MRAKPKLILLAAILLSLGLSLFSDKINPYYLDVIIGIGINIILAVSLNLINGYTGQFSLGHAGFMAVGGYTSAMITIKFQSLLSGQGSPFVATQLLFVTALLAGGLAAALAGLVVGAPSLRLKGDYLAIVTLGFGEIIRVILQNTNAVGASRGLTGVPFYTNFFWTFGIAALTVYIILSLVHSTYGRGFLAVHDDEIAAEAIGINTTRYKVTAYVIGAFFAGIAGGLYAHFKQYLNPDGFGFMASIEIVVMVILGGMGNMAGVIVAAILLTLLPEGLRVLSGHSLPLPFLSHPLSLKWIGETRMILYSLALILIMLLRPQGLFTWRNKRQPDAKSSNPVKTGGFI
jgi:branched-chain amino acid transport system permease protein